MLLEVRDVTCGYSADKPIVKNVNLCLDEGEICCILGPNGVGKTTLFKTILNLIKPLKGKVSVNGSDTSGWSPRQIASCFAYVAQTHVPNFPYMVKDVAMMGRLGAIRSGGQPSRRDYEIVEQALEDVGIRHLRDKVYTEISGGERQLLMIARALAQQPKILIMDEPTANLDYGNMLLVIGCIRNLAADGLCVIFTTHMPDQAFMCNAKTELLFRGGAPEFGDAAQVITEKNLYEAYHSDIQILEVMDMDGRPLKVVAPRFKDR